MKSFLEKDFHGNWNTIPPVPEDKLIDVNCHKFALYTLGKMSWDEMTSDARLQKEAGKEFIFSKAALEISDLEFQPINNLDDLVKYLNQNCELDKYYIGQILDVGTKELAHSFIIQKTEKDKFKCFDKPGFKYPFSVYSEKEIYDFVNKDGEQPYKNQKWRVVQISN